MMKVLAIALSAPLLLIGAAYPEMPKSDGADPLASEETSLAGPVTYRPCRPGPGDDRCIQLYERGVRASYARWLRQHGVERAPVQVAMGGPPEENVRPPRRNHGGPAPRHERAEDSDGHQHGTDARCFETRHQGGEPRGM